MEDDKWNEVCDSIKSITKNNCYNCNEVLTLELVGDRVIRTLLDAFVGSLVFSDDKTVKDVRTYEGKLYSKISSNYKYMACMRCGENSNRSFDDLSLYERIQLCVDFISGMTDSYAVNLYKELIGVQLP